MGISCDVRHEKTDLKENLRVIQKFLGKGTT